MSSAESEREVPAGSKRKRVQKEPFSPPSTSQNLTSTQKRENKDKSSNSNEDIIPKLSLASTKSKKELTAKEKSRDEKKVAENILNRSLSPTKQFETEMNESSNNQLGIFQKNQTSFKKTHQKNSIIFPLWPF